jgi:hypothetical protein
MRLLSDPACVLSGCPVADLRHTVRQACLQVFFQQTHNAVPRTHVTAVDAYINSFVARRGEDVSLAACKTANQSPQHP